MPSLLDLPPELFEIIVGRYVAAAGIHQAWLRRIVNSTFRIYIERKITHNLPLHVLKNPQNRKLVMRLLPRVLEGRVLRNMSPSILPDMVSRIVDQMLAHNGSAATSDQDTAKRLVCMTIANGDRRLAFALCLHPSKTQTKSVRYTTGPINNETLCIAVASNDHHLIQSLVTAGVSVWDKSLFFGHTLEFAAANAPFDTFQVLVNCIQIPSHGRLRGTYNILLRNRIVTLLASSEACAMELLKLYAANYGLPNRETFKVLLQRALEQRAGLFALDLLRMLPPTSDEYWTETIRGTFILRSEYPTNVVALMRLLLDRRIFNKDSINNPPRWPDRKRVDMHPVPSYSLLDIAVWTEDRDLVLLALEHGANPDGVKVKIEYGIELSHPLAFAIKHRLYEMIEILVEAGASPIMGGPIGYGVYLVNEYLDDEDPYHKFMLDEIRTWEKNLWSDPRPR